MDIFKRYSKYAILLLVIILLGEIAFYLFATSPSVGNKSLTLFGPSEESLKASIAEEKGKIEKYKKDIEDTLKRTKINLNYFNKDRAIENISPLLEDLRRYSEEANVPILSIEPQPVEKADNYLKRSFYISLRGDYKDIVRFVSALEHKGGFSTGKFEITTGTGKKGEEKRFKFLLSAFKIANSKIPVIEDWIGVSDNIVPPANDPFKSIMEEIADSVKQSEQVQAANRLLDIHKKGLEEDKEEDLSSLNLEAVADINGTRTAIINHSILKEGDSYEGFVIKRIEIDAVIIVKNGKEYTLRLYSLSPMVQDRKTIDIKLGQRVDFNSSPLQGEVRRGIEELNSASPDKPKAVTENVIPANAGIQRVEELDSRWNLSPNVLIGDGNDELEVFSGKKAAEVTNANIPKEDKKELPFPAKKEELDIPNPLSVPDINKPVAVKPVREVKNTTAEKTAAVISVKTDEIAEVKPAVIPQKEKKAIPAAPEKTKHDLLSVIPHPLSVPNITKPIETKQAESTKTALKKPAEAILEAELPQAVKAKAVPLPKRDKAVKVSNITPTKDIKPPAAPEKAKHKPLAAVIPHPLSAPEVTIKADKPPKIVKGNPAKDIKNAFSVVVASCVFEECAGETEKRLAEKGLSSFKRHKLHALINTYSVVLDTPVEKAEAERIVSDIKGAIEFNIISSGADRFILKSSSFVYKKRAEEILNKVKEKGYSAGITMDREDRLVNKLIVSGFDSYANADNMSAELKTAGFTPIVYKDEELFK